MRVVFFCLQYDKKDREFFNLKTDIYGFIISHWNKLSLNKKRSDNWHKQIQDMLSHSKNLFESGMEKYKQNGFWRMKQNHDPWTMHKPRSYNWTKRASRTTEGADSDYITVFDVTTGAVVQEGDLESPRKKIRGDDDSGDETTKQSLEEEIRNLREALAEMSENLSLVKEELKKKDQEILHQNFTYHKTLEQLEALKLAHGQSDAGMGQERDPTLASSQSWPEPFSPRTASPFRHLYPSTPPPSRLESAHYSPTLSRPLEPAHYPSPPPPVHLGPNFPASRPLFPPFDLPLGVSASRRFSPPSLPFPPSSLNPPSESSLNPPPYLSYNPTHSGSPVPFSQPPSNSQQPIFQSNPSQFEFKSVSSNLLSLSAPLPASSYSISLTPEHFSSHHTSPHPSPHHTPRGPPP